MFKYGLQVIKETGVVILTLLKCPWDKEGDCSVKFTSGIGVIKTEWDRAFLRMWFRGHLDGFAFMLPIEKEELELDQNDLLGHDQVTKFFREDQPSVVVTSTLDWLTFSGFFGLAIKNQLSLTSKEFNREKDHRKPSSKKEVLKDWTYQS